MICGLLGVPAMYQHRACSGGIAGALILRGLMIAVRAVLITTFSWIIYVSGGFLIITGIKMLLVPSGEASSLDRNLLVRATRWLFSVTERYHGERFVVRAGEPRARDARLPDRDRSRGRPGQARRAAGHAAVPRAGVVEFTDLIFAVDSIPATFAVTTDSFLVFTRSVFAILGLRSLYFALAGMIDRFRYLKVSLSVVLMVIGVKMMTHTYLKAWLGEHFNFYMLGVIALIFAAGVIASMITTRPTHEEKRPTTPSPARTVA